MIMICDVIMHDATLIVSPQMTLTADELIFHKICVPYDIETILDQNCQVCGKSIFFFLRVYGRDHTISILQNGGGGVKKF